MPTAAKKWDDRYRSESFRPGTEPPPFLCEVLPLLPRGRALDLAMGAGRNAVFLAASGWRVTGVDCSQVALDRAEAHARLHGIHIERTAAPSLVAVPRTPGIVLCEADLETCPLPASQYELVVGFYYLQPSLFPAIQRALRPGGMVVYETYTLEQLRFVEGPHNPDHLLKPGELRDAFPGLETLFYRELRAGKGIASLLARKP